MFGVSARTVFNWEKNASTPVVRAYPAIMKFLGYCPVQYPQLLGDRIRLHRTYQGYNISEFTNILGVDESTLRSWERSLEAPVRQAKSRAVISKIFMPESQNV